MVAVNQTVAAGITAIARVLLLLLLLLTGVATASWAWKGVSQICMLPTSQCTKMPLYKCVNPDIATLKQCANETIIDYPGRNLSGTIPDRLLQFNLHGWQRWDLSDNQLTGTLPKYLWTMPNMRAIFLSFNQLSGNLPVDPPTTSALQAINLQSNLLEGRLPACLQELTNVNVLDLGSNQLSGTLAKNMFEMTKLMYVDLFQNRLSGPLPQFDSKSNVKNLTLFKNALTGTIPSSIGMAKSLDKILLFQNQLTGTLPTSMSQLTSLRMLDLYDNLLTGLPPGSIAPRLMSLALGHNDFSGTFPDQISVTQKTLNNLELHTNHFTGTLPLWLKDMNQLTELLIFRNKFSGPIPMLGKAMKVAGLHENSFSGRIPEAFALNSPNLTKLLLQVNQISGTLPASLASASLLKVLDITHNHVSGTIPRNFSNLKDFRQIYLSENQLSGTLSALVTLSERNGFSCNALNNLYDPDGDGPTTKKCGFDTYDYCVPPSKHQIAGIGFRACPDTPNGKNCSFTCMPGFTPTGVKSILCSRGQWIGIENARCTWCDFCCGPVPSVKHLKPTSCLNKNRQGSIIISGPNAARTATGLCQGDDIKCKTNYQAIPGASILCVDGFWVNPVNGTGDINALCTPQKCTTNNLEQTASQVLWQWCNLTQPGEKCRILCKDKYMWSDQAYATCNAGTNWSGVSEPSALCSEVNILYVSQILLQCCFVVFAACFSLVRLSIWKYTPSIFRPSVVEGKKDPRFRCWIVMQRVILAVLTLSLLTATVLAEMLMREAEVVTKLYQHVIDASEADPPPASWKALETWALSPYVHVMMPQYVDPLRYVCHWWILSIWVLVWFIASNLQLCQNNVRRYASGRGVADNYARKMLGRSVSDPLMQDSSTDTFTQSYTKSMLAEPRVSSNARSSYTVSLSYIGDSDCSSSELGLESGSFASIPKARMRRGQREGHKHWTGQRSIYGQRSNTLSDTFLVGYHMRSGYKVALHDLLEAELFRGRGHLHVYTALFLALATVCSIVNIVLVAALGCPDQNGLCYSALAFTIIMPRLMVWAIVLVTVILRLRHKQGLFCMSAFLTLCTLLVDGECVISIWGLFASVFCLVAMVMMLCKSEFCRKHKLLTPKVRAKVRSLNNGKAASSAPLTTWQTQRLYWLSANVAPRDNLPVIIALHGNLAAMFAGDQPLGEFQQILGHQAPKFREAMQDLASGSLDEVLAISGYSALDLLALAVLDLTDWHEAEPGSNFDKEAEHMMPGLEQKSDMESVNQKFLFPICQNSQIEKSIRKLWKTMIKTNPELTFARVTINNLLEHQTPNDALLGLWQLILERYDQPLKILLMQRIQKIISKETFLQALHLTAQVSRECFEEVLDKKGSTFLHMVLKFCIVQKLKPEETVGICRFCILINPKLSHICNDAGVDVTALAQASGAPSLMTVLSVTLYGRFQLVSKHPHHRSSTSEVYYCVDVEREFVTDDGMAKPLVIKVMRHQSQFEREMNARKQRRAVAMVPILWPNTVKDKSCMRDWHFRHLNASGSDEDDDADLKSSLGDMMLSPPRTPYPRTRSTRSDPTLSSHRYQREPSELDLTLTSPRRRREEITSTGRHVAEKFPFAIVMARARRTLNAAMTETRFSRRGLHRLCRDIATSLAYMHAGDVIHGDVRPRNIAQMQDGSWLLLDLDASADSGKPFSRRVQCAYSAPELFSAPNSMDETHPGVASTHPGGTVTPPEGTVTHLESTVLATPKADVWSFGATLFEVLTERPLFPKYLNDDLQADGHKMLKEWKCLSKENEKLLFQFSKRGPHRSRNFEVQKAQAFDLLSKCLSADPDLRPSFIDILQHPFLKDVQSSRATKHATDRPQHWSSTPGVRGKAKMVDVTQKLRAYFQKMVNASIARTGGGSRLLGKGRDTRWKKGPYDTLEVMHVFRIEHLHSWRCYVTKRQKIQEALDQQLRCRKTLTQESLEKILTPPPSSSAMAQTPSQTPTQTPSQTPTQTPSGSAIIPINSRGGSLSKGSPRPKRSRDKRAMLPWGMGPKFPWGWERRHTSGPNNDVNEVWLFHGTKPENVQPICDDGLDEHFSPDDGLFGRGLYFTDAASKANQYGTPVRAGHGNYPAFKGLFPMFVVRVCLGAPVGSEQNPVVPTAVGRLTKKLLFGKSIGSPQAVAKEWAKEHVGYSRHSVIGRGIHAKDTGLEYVVYYGEQTHVEYILYYKRKNKNKKINKSSSLQYRTV